MFCIHCGKDIPENAVVCPECGQPTAQQQVKYCTHCGKPVAENAEICMSCGCYADARTPKGDRSAINGNQAEKSSNPLAYVGFTLGILGIVIRCLEVILPNFYTIFFLPLLFGIAGFICSLISLVQNGRKNPFGWIGLIVSALPIIILVFFVLFYLIFFVLLALIFI